MIAANILVVGLRREIRRIDVDEINAFRRHVHRVAVPRTIRLLVVKDGGIDGLDSFDELLAHGHLQVFASVVIPNSDVCEKTARTLLRARPNQRRHRDGLLVRIAHLGDVRPQDVDRRIVVIREVDPLERPRHEVIDLASGFKQRLDFTRRKRDVVVLNHGLRESRGHRHVVIAQDLLAHGLEHVADNARTREQIDDGLKLEPRRDLPDLGQQFPLRPHVARRGELLHLRRQLCRLIPGASGFR